KGTDWCGRNEPVDELLQPPAAGLALEECLVGEIALRRRLHGLVPPWVTAAVGAARRPFPLLCGREAFFCPFAKVGRRLPRDAVDRMVVTICLPPVAGPRQLRLVRCA